MNETRGVFIVLEGSDGSGKSTQFNLLKERLKATGYEVAVFDFPRYSEKSSYFVRNYLRGEYGAAAEISPYTASLFYALDRYEAAKDIQAALDDGKIVLADRYVGANMAYQGSKFDDPAEQRGFFVWDDNLEYQLLKIPRPDITFFLRVPAEVSRQLLEERATKTGIMLDEHEKDSNLLKKTLATYDVLCRLFPKDFKAIECSRDNELMSVPEINNLIWERLKPLLPQEKPHPSHSVVVTLGLNDAATAAAVKNPAGELTHLFKDASLLFRLQLQRCARLIIKPEYTSWQADNYKFYTPQGLPRELAATYRSSLQRIAELHEQLHRQLTTYLERQSLNQAKIEPEPSVPQLLLPVTPLAALTSFQIGLKKKDLKSLAAQLLANDSAEVQWAAKQLYLIGRQKWGDDFKQPLESNAAPESLSNIIAKLAQQPLGHDQSPDESARLLEAYPRLEFDLLAESIYPYTNLSLEDITEEVAAWPYLQKYESLKQAAAQPELLKKVRYKLDIISDQITLSEIIETGELENVPVQAFTPRYGFEVPEIIEAAGADDAYNECFDESLKLYSLLQGGGRENLAVYATLMGHRIRWQLNVTADDMKRITANPKPGHKQITDNILEKMSEVHPLLWEIISRSAAPTPPNSKNGKNRVKSYRQRPANKNRRKSH